MFTNSKQRFLSAFKEATIPVVGKPTRLLGDATIELVGEVDTGFKLGQNEVYLSDLRAAEMRKGTGTETMKFLAGLADKFNVDIVLHASGTTDDGPSDYKLREFYRGFGFVRSGSNGEMVRKALVDQPQPTAAHNRPVL